MKLGLSLGMTVSQSGGGTAFFVSLGGLTLNPYYGFVPQIGVELTAASSNFTDGPPVSIAYTWNNVTGTPTGTNGEIYTPVAGDDLNVISVTATASDIYDPQDSSAFTVRYQPHDWLTFQGPALTGDFSRGGDIVNDTGQTNVTQDAVLTFCELDGVDMLPNFVGDTWNTTGFPLGEIRAQWTLTGSGGPDELSSMMTYQLLEYSGILDKVGYYPEVGISMVRLTGNYTGPALKLYVDLLSAPNNEFDIGWVRDGVYDIPDVAEIISRLDVNGTPSRGYVEMYDQLGGFHTTAPVASKPKISDDGITVFLANGRLYCEMDGVNDYLDMVLTTFSSAPSSELYVDYMGLYQNGSTNNRFARFVSMGEIGSESWNTAGHITICRNNATNRIGIENLDQGVGLGVGAYQIQPYAELFRYELIVDGGVGSGYLNGGFIRDYTTTSTEVFNFGRVRFGRELANVTNAIQAGGLMHCTICKTPPTIEQRLLMQFHYADFAGLPLANLNKTVADPGDIILFQENGTGRTVTSVNQGVEGGSQTAIPMINTVAVMTLDTASPIVDEVMTVLQDDGQELICNVEATPIPSPAAIFSDRSVRGGFYNFMRPETLLDGSSSPVVDGAIVSNVTDLSGEGVTATSPAGGEPLRDDTEGGLYFPNTGALSQSLTIPHTFEFGVNYATAMHFRWDQTNDATNSGVPITSSDDVFYIFAFKENAPLYPHHNIPSGALMYVDDTDVTNYNQHQMFLLLQGNVDRLLIIRNCDGFGNKQFRIGGYNANPSNEYNQPFWCRAVHVIKEGGINAEINNSRRWYGDNCNVAAFANNLPVPATLQLNVAIDTPGSIDVVTPASDPDGDPMHLELVYSPDGLATIDGGDPNTINFTPDAGYTGTTSIAYVLSDHIDEVVGNVTVIVGAADTFDFGSATNTGPDTFDFGDATSTGPDTFDFGV